MNLLGDGVAGEHAVQRPGADSALGIVGVVAAEPERTAIVVCRAANDIADVARMDPPHGLAIELAGAGLKVDQHDAVFLRPQATGLGHGAAARHVHRDRLGQ